MNTFTQVIGQNQALELLIQAHNQKRLAPAYLFYGTNGIGRSLTAKYFTEVLFCSNLDETKLENIQRKLATGNHPDLLWIEPTYLHQGKYLTPQEAKESGLKRKAPPQIRIEQIREIIYFLNRPPLLGSRSLVIIEEAQSMTEAAANALLKTLEEPGKATIILIASSLDSLLPTLVSRCQIIPFYRLSKENLIEILNINQHHEILEYPEILEIAQGSPGEAINSFQQLQNIDQNLRSQLLNLPNKPVEILDLAHQISEQLDTESQLWLIDYLQYCYWQKWQQKNIIEQLDNTRKYLLSYVQPRLVWECSLIYISQHSKIVNS